MFSREAELQQLNAQKKITPQQLQRVVDLFRYLTTQPWMVGNNQSIYCVCTLSSHNDYDLFESMANDFVSQVKNKLQQVFSDQLRNDLYRLKLYLELTLELILHYPPRIQLRYMHSLQTDRFIFSALLTLANCLQQDIERWKITTGAKPIFGFSARKVSNDNKVDFSELINDLSQYRQKRDADLRNVYFPLFPFMQHTKSEKVNAADFLIAVLNNKPIAKLENQSMEDLVKLHIDALEQKTLGNIIRKFAHREKLGTVRELINKAVENYTNQPIPTSRKKLAII